MGIEQVLQEAQQRKLHREQARADARAAFLALDEADQPEMLAEFVEVVMAGKRTASESQAPTANAPNRAVGPKQSKKPKQSKTDQAEALVRARPGISVKEVAAHIKQNSRTAGSTLAQLAKNRGSIKSKNGGWYPVVSKVSKATEGSGSTVRDSVVQIMGDGVARGTRDIIKAIQAMDPDANKNSINAAVYRMATMDPPMLIKRTVDGGLVYVLASADTKIQDAKVAPAA